MKNIILVLVSVLTIGAQAQEAADTSVQACVNQEFLGMSGEAAQGLLVEEIMAELGSAKSEAEVNAIRETIPARVQQKTLDIIDPYVTKNENSDGVLIIDLIDEELLSALSAICNALGDVADAGQPTLDKESLIYKTLVKERKAIEATIQPQLDEIKTIEATIAELQEKIATIQSGIVAETAKITEIDTFVQEKLTVPGKTQEEVQAAVLEATKRPEIIVMMENINLILEEKLSASAGEEVKLALDEAPAATEEVAQQPTPEAEEAKDDDFGDLVFK